MGFSSIVDDIQTKRKHRWEVVDMGTNGVKLPCEKCMDCGLVIRRETRELRYRGEWVKAAVPRCGDVVQL